MTLYCLHRVIFLQHPNANDILLLPNSLILDKKVGQRSHQNLYEGGKIRTIEGSETGCIVAQANDVDGFSVVGV